MSNRRITVVLDSGRTDKRAPLYWRIQEAKKNPPVTFEGRLI